MYKRPITLSISPRSCIGGGVKIYKDVHIGMGAVVNQSIIINENSIVGSGAVVIREVKRDITVVGNPSRIIRGSYDVQ